MRGGLLSRGGVDCDGAAFIGDLGAVSGAAFVDESVGVVFGGCAQYSVGPVDEVLG